MIMDKGYALNDISVNSNIYKFILYLKYNFKLI